jgi:3-hydroxyisobutyrate dehydrogenase-like beta-hydroxyacid dehydrogenase
MEKYLLGFIGFGEAAFHISNGLYETSKPRVFAFDVMAQDNRLGITIRERAQTANVQLVDSLENLINQVDFILCTTSAKYALSIAQEAVQFLKTGKVYADLNSASPMIKRDISRIVDKSGAVFVDAAVMEIVPPHRHRVPIAASGSGAKKFADTLNSLGMNIQYINGSAGSSSAMKMFRSIFIKGFTSLLLETLTPAFRMGVEAQVMESISGTLTKNTPEQLANMLINRTAVNAARRVSEMEDVVATLAEMNLESFSAQATVTRLKWICDIGLREYFNGKAPEHYSQVLKAVSDIKDKNSGGKV